jgi:hypothetical protein
MWLESASRSAAKMRPEDVPAQATSSPSKGQVDQSGTGCRLGEREYLSLEDSSHPSTTQTQNAVRHHAPSLGRRQFRIGVISELCIGVQRFVTQQARQFHKLARASVDREIADTAPTAVNIAEQVNYLALLELD